MQRGIPSRRHLCTEYMRTGSRDLARISPCKNINVALQFLSRLKHAKMVRISRGLSLGYCRKACKLLIVGTINHMYGIMDDKHELMIISQTLTTYMLGECLANRRYVHYSYMVDF